jgi:TetR/AcrR family transcriptional repressor of mexJK operon
MDKSLRDNSDCPGKAAGRPKAADVEARTQDLLEAAAKRNSFFRNQPMETDPRPLRAIVDEFAHQMFDLINSPEAIDMQRIVLAEAASNPGLVDAFWNGGPLKTRQMLARFFARDDIRAASPANRSPASCARHASKRRPRHGAIWQAA